MGAGKIGERRLSWVVWLLVTLAVAAPSCAGAAAATAAPVLRMVTEEWPPFRINDPGRESGFRGIDIDVVAVMEERLGVKIRIERHPWARALEMMRSGQVDLLSGVARTAEREAFMHYVGTSYCAVRPRFFTTAGRGKEIAIYEHLRGKTIGYSLHSAYFEPFDSDLDLDKKGLSTETQLLQALALKRLDLIIGTEPNLSYDIARLGLAGAVEPTSYQPTRQTDLFFAFSRKSPQLDLAGRVEEVLAGLVKEGVVGGIVATYTGAP